MRSPQQCQVYWYNKLHPFLNYTKWTKEEDKLLLSLAEKSTGGNWETIALELKVLFKTELNATEHFMLNLSNILNAYSIWEVGKGNINT